MPADRTDYNNCIKPYMNGQAMPDEPDRKMRFCIGAKICSGKATDQKQARQICIDAPPPAPRGTGKRKGKACFTQVEAIAACILARPEWQTTSDDKSKALKTDLFSGILSECMCGSKPKLSRAAKAQAAFDAMSDEQKQAIQMIEMIKQQYAPKEPEAK